MTTLNAVPSQSGTVYEARLPNGLLVLLKPDHNAPVISLNVAYRVGFATSGPAARRPAVCRGRDRNGSARPRHS